MTAPLDGLLVVDLSRALAGPHATMMMGDLGASRDQDRGARRRRRHPRLGTSVRRRRRAAGVHLLPVREPQQGVDRAGPQVRAGRGALAELVGRADVLVRTSRTGVLDRLGFGIGRLRELNPRLVVLSISGFGHDGPEGGPRPGTTRSRRARPG